MKKTLIALTLAALPVASMAEVVLYGQIKGGVEVSKYKKSGGDDKGTITNIVDYGSRIGFKGKERLNDSLNAIWQLEQKVDIAGGKKPRGFGTRTSFIGLTGNFGTAKVGYLKDPVGAVNDKLDYWNYKSEAAGLSSFARSNDAVGRRVAVSYETPDMAGFKAKAYVSPSDNNLQEGDLTATGDHRSADRAVYGLGASYENNGFFADVAGTYVKNGARNRELKENSTWKTKNGYQAVAQVGVDMNNTMVGIAYQHAQNVDLIDNDDLKSPPLARLDEVAATAAYTVDDALTLKGSVAHGFKAKTLNSGKLEKYDDGRYIQGVLGADYGLSKRTKLTGQVGYLQKGKENKMRTGTVGVGMTHKF